MPPVAVVEGRIINEAAAAIRAHNMVRLALGIIHHGEIHARVFGKRRAITHHATLAGVHHIVFLGGRNRFRHGRVTILQA